MDLKTRLESKSNFVNLIHLICTAYKLDPALKINIINVKSFLESLDSESFISKYESLTDANAAIVKLYETTISSNRSSLPDDIDATRNYLIRLIKSPGDDAANGGSGYKDTFEDRKESLTESTLSSILDMPPPQRLEIIKYLNYASLFRDEYILADSRYQNIVNADPTKLIFSLITSTKTKSDHGGVIVGNRIQNIVEVEVYPFTIPYKPVYVTFYNKITLTINEWQSNSFEAYEGGQFHFCFDIDRIDNNLIYLRPINATYSFSTPVNYIDSFSLSFGAVFPKIAFDADRMYPSSISYTNPYGLLTFSIPHNLVSGDLIYITGFTTPDEAADSTVIAEVNRPQGHTIVKKDNYSFIINIDLTTIRREVPVNSGIYPIDSFVQPALVYFASKRIQVQFRLKYLTNYTI